MDEKQLLKEIAYYSRVIDQHKRWDNASCHTANYLGRKHAPHFHNKYKFTMPKVPVINSYKLVQAGARLVAPAPAPPAPPPPLPRVVTRTLRDDREQLTLKVIKDSSSARSVTNLKLSPASTPRKRRVSIRTKYKIVKGGGTGSAVEPVPATSKYKIDRRTDGPANRSVTRRRVVTQGISDMLRANLFRNKTWRRASDAKAAPGGSGLTNISGVLYKRSKNKLQRVQPGGKPVRSPLKRLLSSRGGRYSADVGRRSLRLAASPSKYSLNNSRRRVNVQRPRSTLVKPDPSATKKQRVRQQTLRLRKNNIPCPTYRRLGKCRRKELGRCCFNHDPNQVTLCKRFLQGACIDEGCLLSHKTTLEKMPTCKYFLEGCCVRSGCPYLHVRINPRADVCRSFLQGFCVAGEQCDKRHQFLCPDWERAGRCPRPKCRFPHREREAPRPRRPERPERPAAPPEPREDAVEVNRYYEDVRPEPAGVSGCAEPAGGEEASARPRLGQLPAFIPLG